MPRAKQFYYVIDGLDDESALVIKKGLSVVGDVKDVQVNVGRGMAEVQAYRDVEAQVRLACDVAGVTFRTRAKP